MLETLVRQLNMVRLSAGMAALLLAVGCTGLIDEGTDGQTPEQTLARRLWIEKATPALQGCVSCHNGSRPGIEFLSGSGELAVRDTLMAYDPPVVNLDAPQSSRLLTKGAHEGPALVATETSDILEWITAEKNAQASTGETPPTLQTARFTPAICTAGTPPATTCPVNDLDLTELGVPGAKVHFVAQALGSGLYLNQLSVVAGEGGAYIEHPLFVSYPAEGEAKPDMIDRFFNVKMNMMPNATEQLGGGTASFANFLATDQIAIHFKTVGPYQPETGGGETGAGGCKVLQSFKDNARALFTTNVGGAGNNCNACHAGQNGNATSALNITGINSADDMVVLNACNQILTRINKVTPDQSGIYLAVDPTNTNHPFRFTAAQLTTFKSGPPGTGINGWINAEKTAP